jgi:hypothetical protein
MLRFIFTTLQSMLKLYIMLIKAEPLTCSLM